MEDGYRVSWQTTLGGSPQGIVYPNMKKWSGDHGGYDFATTAGVLIANRRLTTTDAVDHGHRADGAEVLRGADPADIDGKPFSSGRRPRQAKAGGPCAAALVGSRTPWPFPLSSRSARAHPVTRRSARRPDRDRRPRRQTDRRSAARAAARGGRARRAGAHAAGRAAQARGRTADQRRAAGEDRARTRRRSAEARCGRGRGGALAQTAATQLPDVEARLVQLYKMGRAGYWRLLLERRRPAGARPRVSHRLDADPSRSRPRAASTTPRSMRSRASARRCRRALKRSGAPGRSRPRARRGRRRPSPPGPRWSAAIDARRDLNAQLVGELQAAQQKLQASIVQMDAGRGPRSPAPLAAVPGRPALAGPRRHRPPPVRTPADQPVRHGDRQKRHGDRGRRGTARPQRPRGNRRVCRPVQGLRQPRHRRPRRPGPIRSTATSARWGARGQRLDPQAAVGTVGGTPAATLRCTSSYASTASPVDPLQWLKKGPDPGVDT